MSHNYQNLEIVDSAKLKLPVFSDERGEFSRLFCQNIFASLEFHLTLNRQIH